jgi:hypothetical protein
MGSVSKILLAAGIAVLLAGPSLAQGPRGGNPLGRMLDNKDLQKELKLTEDQVTKAKGAADDVFKKHADDFKDIDFRSPEGREKMGTMMREVGKETLKAMDSVLNADQMKRFRQIMLQQSINMQGPAVFNDPEVQKDLKLTDEQKDKIKTINSDLGEDRAELFKEAQSDPAKGREAFQKMPGLNKEAMDKANKVLTTSQKKTLEELKGEPFEIKFERPPPR